MTRTAEQPSVPTASIRLDRGVLKVAGVVALGSIMSIVDATVVNIALPSLQSAFAATYSQVAWAVTSYTLALATIIPMTGWVADRFGTRGPYITALAFFVGGSIACGLAWNLPTLIIFRVLQGFGGGMLVPLGMTITKRAAGPARIARVMALVSIPTLLGPMGGPPLGGWLVEIASWRWIFFINIPVGVLSLVCAVRVLPRDRPVRSDPFDIVGLLLLSPALALFLYGISSASDGADGAASANVIVPTAGGILLMTAFVWHALHASRPLVDLRLLRSRQLIFSMLTIALFGIAYSGAMLLLPTYFLTVRGVSTVATGLLLIPQGIGAVLAIQVVGRLAHKVAVAKLVTAGLLVCCTCLALFTGLTARSSYVSILAVLFLLGIGVGMTMNPLFSSVLASFSDATVARGTTLMSVAQQTAAAAGTAVVSVVLTIKLLPGQGAGEAAEVSGGQRAQAFSFTFWAVFGFMVLALIPAVRLPRRVVRYSVPDSAISAGQDDPDHTRTLGEMTAVDKNDRSAPDSTLVSPTTRNEPDNA